MWQGPRVRQTPAGTHRTLMSRKSFAAFERGPATLRGVLHLGGGYTARDAGNACSHGDRRSASTRSNRISRTEARSARRASALSTFVSHHRNFPPAACSPRGPRPADLILADLGVSSMQLDNPTRLSSFFWGGGVEFFLQGAWSLDMRRICLAAAPHRNSSRSERNRSCTLSMRTPTKTNRTPSHRGFPEAATSSRRHRRRALCSHCSPPPFRLLGAADVKMSAVRNLPRCAVRDD